MKLKLLSLLLVLGIAGCASPDPALVGTWQGERSATADCLYVAWTAVMTNSGAFGTVFFADAARSQPRSKRGGHWITRGQLVLFDAVGVTKYNVYQYQFVDKDTVHFKSINAEEPGCKFLDYTDRRVSP